MARGAKRRTRVQARGPGSLSWRGPSRPRIMRPRDPFTKTTLQPGGTKGLGQAVSISKNVGIQAGKRITSARGKVRRLYVRDPYNQNSVTGIMSTGATVARFAPEAEKVDILNANPAFHPEGTGVGASGVRGRKDQVANQTPGKASRGHGNVVRRTLFNQTGGKRLKRL